jgi:TonB family protein
MAQEEAAGSRIFISYRREDAIAHVNALFTPLRNRFGEERVFKDTDNIAPGQDFTKVIQSQLKTCSVLLAVIGKHWLTARKSKSDVRRIDDPHDYLRVEIVTALRNESVLVIPLLVGEATMPTAEDLPEELVPLSYRNGFELRDSRWESDVTLLIRSIEKACGEPEAASPRPASRPPEPRPATAEKPPAHERGGLDRLAARRNHQIAEHVNAARQALDALQYEDALEACEKALWLDPQDGDARDLQERAQGALDEQKIQAWLVEARQLMSGEQVQDAQLTAASELIDQAIAVNPGHEAATALRGEVLVLRRQRERDRDDARHVRAVLARARENLELEEFDACIAGCDDALTVSPGSAEGSELRQRAVAARDERRRNREIRQRAEKAVREARAELAVGNRDAALTRLEGFQPPHELVQQAIEELRARLPPASIAAPTPIAATTAAAARAEIPPTPPAVPAAAEPAPIRDRTESAGQPAADVRRSSRVPVLGAAVVAVLVLAGLGAWALFGRAGDTGQSLQTAPSSPQSSSSSPPAPRTGAPAGTTDSTAAPASAASPASPAASAPPTTENSTPPPPGASTPALTAPATDPVADAGPARAGSERATRPPATSGEPAASQSAGQPRQADVGTAKKGDPRGGTALKGVPAAESTMPAASPKDTAAPPVQPAKPSAEKPPDEAPVAKPPTREITREGTTTRVAQEIDIKEPRQLKQVPPVYPKAALDAGVQGAVTLVATVGEDGKVRNVRVVKSIPLLDQAAIDALKQWEYAPGTRNGVAFAIEITVTISFSM